MSDNTTTDEQPSNVREFKARTQGEFKAPSRVVSGVVTAKYVAMLAPFATPHHAFTNMAFPGILVQPLEEGCGVSLTATDGSVLVRTRDEDGKASAPFWLGTPPALVDACRAPKPPRLHAVGGGHFPVEMPDYLLPGTVHVHVTQWGEDKDDTMELVSVLPKAMRPDLNPKTDEGGAFYTWTTDKGSQVLKRAAWLAQAPYGGFEKALTEAHRNPLTATDRVILNTNYVQKIAKLGKALKANPQFVFHGSEKCVGVSFAPRDGSPDVFVTLMPMKPGDLREPVLPEPPEGVMRRAGEIL